MSVLFDLMLKYWFITLGIALFLMGLELRIRRRGERKRMERQIRGFTRDREW